MIPPSVAALGPFELVRLRARQRMGWAPSDQAIAERDEYAARTDHEIKMALEARRIRHEWAREAGLGA